MLHPSTTVQFINDLIGQGVFATEFIPKGTILWVRDQLDQELTPAEVEQLYEPVRERFLTYSYRNSKGNYIFCWDNTRYINHSHHANCMTTPYGFEIAIKDIAKGEQITNDYGTLNIIEPFEPCDEAGRDVVKPNDIADFHKEWDVKIKESILMINNTDQPLKKYFTPEHWQTVQSLATGREKPISILNCLLK